VTELTATVAHRDAAYHQLTAEVWWRRAQNTIASRGREDAESLARNAKVGRCRLIPADPPPS